MVAAAAAALAVEWGPGSLGVGLSGGAHRDTQEHVAVPRGFLHVYDLPPKFNEDIKELPTQWHPEQYDIDQARRVMRRQQSLLKLPLSQLGEKVPLTTNRLLRLTVLFGGVLHAHLGVVGSQYRYWLARCPRRQGTDVGRRRGASSMHEMSLHAALCAAVRMLNRIAPV